MPEEYDEYVDSEFENIIAFQYWDDEEWTEAMFTLSIEAEPTCCPLHTQEHRQRHAWRWN